MSPLRIAILCYPTFGGSGVLATQLAQSLAERGHTIHLLSYATPSRLQAFTRNLCFHQVEVNSYPLFKYPSYDLALAAKIVELGESHGLDIIHAHYAIPHSISAVLASDILQCGSKVITTLHGTDITLLGSEQIYGPLIYYALKHSHGVTAVSEFLAAESKKNCCPRTAIEVIPNFIDLQEFRPPTTPPPSHPPIVTHISNFRPVKRVLQLIEIFALIRERTPCTLHLVGEGPDLGRARTMVKELGLEDSTVFLGQQADVASILQQSSLFLMTSETESFGLSALEALACGVPAVCMDVGGLREVIVEGQSGYLTPDADLESMANTCVELLQDSSRLDIMRQHARRRAEDFSKEKVVGLYEAFYRQVLSR